MNIFKFTSIRFIKYVYILFLLLGNLQCFAHKDLNFQMFLDKAQKENRNIALIIYNYKDFANLPFNSEVFQTFAKQKLFTIETEVFPKKDEVIEKINGVFLRELFEGKQHEYIFLKRIGLNEGPAIAVCNDKGFVIYHKSLKNISAKTLIQEIKTAIQKNKIVHISEFPLVKN